MNVAAFVGPSGGGKSTAIAGLIRHFIAAGLSVGAIKHTHHALNEEHRGDSATFRDAGADPVVLAGDGTAVVFSRSGTRRARFSRPADLLSLFAVDVVLIEGFKAESAWLQIGIDAQNRPSTAELAALLEQKWRE